MITENLSTLRIHKLTQEQYNRAREAGQLEENAIYLTPDDASNPGGFATEEYVDEKIADLVLESAQADWNQEDESKPDFIHNKPEIPSIEGLATIEYVDSKLTGGTNDPVSWNDIQDKPEIPEAYTHPENHPADMITGLADVAKSGSYNDLIDKPEIPSTEGLATTEYVDNKFAEGSFEQVQANWDQGDVSKADYILNKPFGYGTDLLNDKQLAFSLVGAGTSGITARDRIYSASINMDGWNISDGDVLTITWDGETKEYVAKRKTINQNAASVAIGNVYIANLYANAAEGYISEDTKEPFCILPALGYFFTFSSAATHEVRINKTDEIKKIDSRFLPDEALLSPVQADWSVTDEDDPAFIKNKPDLSQVGGSGIYTDNEEPADAPEGSVWLDMDDDGSNLPIGGTLPPVNSENNGMILQVVDGKWTLVALADSEVKNYVDEYIGSALEGEY